MKKLSAHLSTYLNLKCGELVLLFSRPQEIQLFPTVTTRTNK